MSDSASDLSSSRHVATSVDCFNREQLCSATYVLFADLEKKELLQTIYSETKAWLCCVLVDMFSHEGHDVPYPHLKQFIKW